MKDFSTILLVLLALLIFSVNTHVIPIDISSRGLSSNETSAFPGPLHPRPNYAGRPALKQFSDMTKTAQVLQGHKDAVLLATSAYDNFDATSDAFKRYFEPGDADLVKGIYGLIGGITQAYKGSNNNYGNVQVFYGDDVSVDAFTGGQNGWRNCRNMPYMLGQTIQGLPGRLNLVEVMTCPNMYLLPKLTDVKCSEFGAKPAEDSGWMAAVGTFCPLVLRPSSPIGKTLLTLGHFTYRQYSTPRVRAQRASPRHSSRLRQAHRTRLQRPKGAHYRLCSFRRLAKPSWTKERLWTNAVE